MDGNKTVYFDEDFDSSDEIKIVYHDDDNLITIHQKKEDSRLHMIKVMKELVQ